MQGAWVWSLVKKINPTCRNLKKKKDPERHSKDRRSCMPHGDPVQPINKCFLEKEWEIQEPSAVWEHRRFQVSGLIPGTGGSYPAHRWSHICILGLNIIPERPWDYMAFRWSVLQLRVFLFVLLCFVFPLAWQVTIAIHNPRTSDLITYLLLVTHVPQ